MLKQFHSFVTLIKHLTVVDFETLVLDSEMVSHYLTLVYTLACQRELLLLFAQVSWNFCCCGFYTEVDKMFLILFGVNIMVSLRVGYTSLMFACMGVDMYGES